MALRLKRQITCSRVEQWNFGRSDKEIGRRSTAPHSIGTTAAAIWTSVRCPTETRYIADVPTVYLASAAPACHTILANRAKTRPRMQRSASRPPIFPTPTSWAFQRTPPDQLGFELLLIPEQVMGHD